VKTITNNSTQNYQNKKEKEKITTLDESFAYISQLEEKLKLSQEQVIKFKSLFKSHPSAFAYHEIILDINNKPINYRFIEVNHMFEQILGIEAKNIIGKTVIDVLPGIKKDSTDWIGKYGKVALGGEQLIFEDYSDLLEKWFQITAYSPEKNFFATTFTEIFKEKIIQE
jgi:PAS domain-containing protein